MAAAISGCTTSITTVEQAQAQVDAKTQAVTDAEAAFATASATFCANSKDYVLALDRYGDILHQTAPTVGDVVDAGKDLAAPKAAAFDGADAALKAQAAVLTAQQELAAAQETLAKIAAGASGTPSPVASPNPTLAPLAPAASVERVKAAEKDFTDAQSAITPETPLSDASELFHSAAVGLQLSWMHLFVDTGCATDEQLAQADTVLNNFVMSVQQDLKDAGFYKGEVDGIYGPQTTQAVMDLQKASGLPETGALDQATILALQAELVKQGHAEAKDALATTAAVQQTLKLIGFWDGPVDGVWTDELTQAVKDVQKALGVEQTGVIDAATLAAWEAALAAIKNPSPTPEPSVTPSPSPSTTA